MTGARGPFDAEAILVDWLDANLVTAGVSTAKPANLEDDLPWVTVRRVGSTFVDGTGRLERVRLDVDAYAATEVEAAELIAWAVAATYDLGDASFVHDAGVITDTGVDLGPLNVPDPDTGTAHYVATVALFGHRRAPVGS